MSESILFIVILWLWGALTAFIAFEIAAREGDFLPLTAKDRVLNVAMSLIWPIWNVIIGGIYVWTRAIDFLVGDGKNKTL